VGLPSRRNLTFLGWLLAVTLLGTLGVRELLQNEVTLINASGRSLRSVVLSSDSKVFEERDSFEVGERLRMDVPASTWIDGTLISFRGVFQDGEECWGWVQYYDKDRGLHPRFVIRGPGKAETEQRLMAGMALLAACAMFVAWGVLLLRHRSSHPDRLPG